jgi:CRP-like cAMP-binding protein
MGTTASVLLIAGAPSKLRGFIAHVGDSRIYLTRQGQCHQLTEDHSLMNELLKRGKIKKEEIDSSPYKQFKNAVTRAVGVYPSVEVDTFDFDILPGDSFLLCTDGLYAYFEDDEVPDLLAAGEVADVPGKLVARANDGGGHDNITSVVIRVGQPEEAGEHVEDVATKIEVLKAMQMFRFLSYKELVRVMNITETLELATGAQVFKEGEPGEAMFVVLGGAVAMTRGETFVAELGKGQHFGEMSLVDRSLRSLTAVASEPTRLLSIRRKDFYAIIKKEPQLAVKLLWSFVQVLAERLRKTTSDLTDALKGEERDQGAETDNLFQD